MIVHLVKDKNKKSKFYLTLTPRASNKREKKVVRAIALVSGKTHQYLGTGPSSLGEDASIYVDAITTPVISEKEYKVALASHKEPPWNSAYEVLQGIILDRKVDANIEYHKALRTEEIAKQYGLYKIIPKAIRAKHVCRCGVGYKKKSKLHRHQEYCTVIAAERENFEHFAAIAELITPKKAKDESKGTKEKATRTTRQPVSNKLATNKRKRKKTTRVSKR